MRIVIRSNSVMQLLKSSAVLGVVAALSGCSAAGTEDPSSTVAQSEDVASTEQLLSAPDEDYVATPVGEIHKTCIHESDDADRAFPKCRYKSKLKLQNPASLAAPGPLQPPTVNGWVENSFRFAPAGQWFRQAFSAWTVPNNPSSISNQLVYYFPGFQNLAGTLSIIQPVMQWGNNGRFGGNFWSIASWYVDTAGVAVHSTPRTVTTGQIIDGSMVGSNCTAAGVCSWTITTKVRNGISTTLTRSPGVVYNWAAPAALEAYRLTACNQYPFNTGLNISTNLYLTTSTTKSTLPWSSTVNSVTPSCHYAVTNNPNPGVTLLQAF
ncbi:MAG: hypothetical protein ACOY0T_30520 [Myxococcota bacterium]